MVIPDELLGRVVRDLIAEEYMAGVDELAKAYDQLRVAKKVAITKGLVRRYANAVSKGDTDEMSRVSATLGVISKAGFELFNFATGERRVEVHRDARGRFTSFLDRSTTSNVTPKQRDNDRGQRGTIAAKKPVVDQLSAWRQGAGDPNNPKAGELAQRSQRLAGKVHAINRMQDELSTLFGDDPDVVVVLQDYDKENPNFIGQERYLGLNDPVGMDQGGVTDAALPANPDMDQQMSFGIRDTASPETREKFKTFSGLLNAGLSPDVAANLVSSGAGGIGADQVRDQLLQYSGQAPNSAADKAKRHFKTAETVGGYMTRSGVGPVAALGASLASAGQAGGRLAGNEKLMGAAERANYRYRGMKDNLPKGYTEAISGKQKGAHDALLGAFDDPDLTPEKWAARLGSVEGWLDQANQVKGRDRSGATAVTSDPGMQVLANSVTNTPKGVSPRNFIDRYTADLATVSLLEQLPTDRRAVELGNEAGYGVPSSGIIIRPDGQAKEMYHGVSEDHYLPFSAKALPELRDGQYVRTRNLGGLTPEDVKTLVASGGRRATVLSGNGVFSLELRPDVSLEGRMRSPEVAAMGERYERILDQVAESGMYVRDLPPETKAALRQQAAASAKATSGTVFDARLKKLTDDAYVAAQRVDPEDIKRVTQEVADMTNIGGASNQQRAAIRDQLVKERIHELETEKVRQLRLNDEGYALAMETLRMQYPSIIRRVQHQTLKDFVTSRGLEHAVDPNLLNLVNRPGSSDKNRVKPGDSRSRKPEWGAEKRVRVARDAATATILDAGAGGGARAATGAATPAAAQAAANGLQLVRDQRQAKIGATLAESKAKATALNFGAEAALDMSPTLRDPADVAAMTDTTTGDSADAAYTSRVLPEPGNAARALFKGPGHLQWLATGPTRGQGLMVGNALAFTSSGFQPTDFDASPGRSTNVDEARLAVDDVMSAAIAVTPKINGSPLTDHHDYGFWVPDEVKSVVPTSGALDADAVAAEVTAAAYDPASEGGVARANAKKAMDSLLKAQSTFGPPLDGMGQSRFGHGNADGTGDVSLLGLQALQSDLIQNINAATTASVNNAETKAFFDTVMGGEGSFDDDTTLNAAKKTAREAVQGVVGTEFTLKLLGQGDVGPKGGARVAKADPQAAMLEEYLDMQEQLEASRPKRPRVVRRPLPPKLSPRPPLQLGRPATPLAL